MIRFVKIFVFIRDKKKLKSNQQPNKVLPSNSYLSVIMSTNVKYDSRHFF